MLKTLWQDLVRFRGLIRRLAERDLKTRYKVSVLGFFWSLLRPLLTIAVLAAVFSQLLNFHSVMYDIPYWALLTVGYIPWFYFSTAFLEGTQSLMANAHLVKKVYCPRMVYPTATVLSNGVNFLLSLLVLIPLLYGLTAAFPGWYCLQLPLVIGVHTLLLLGLTFITSTTNVIYRDTTQISEFLIFVWFYLSPVLYDMHVVQSELQGAARWLYFINPMVGIIEWYRFCLLSSSFSGNEWYTETVFYQVIPYSAAVSVFLFFAGYSCLKKLETRAVDQM